MQGKYRCSQCPEDFDSIKEYIAHLEMHEDLMPNVPKPKKGLARIFAKFKRDKEEKTMVDKPTEQKPVEAVTPLKIEPVPPTPPGVNERMDGLERAMNQFAELLTDTIGKLEQAKPTTPRVPPQVKTLVDDPTETIESEEHNIIASGKKKLKVSVIVEEAQSGEFLKVIQGSEAYELDDISVEK